MLQKTWKFWISTHYAVEVIDAANEWLSYNVTEQFAKKKLLLIVRLLLLSDHAIQYHLINNSSFNDNNECV